MMIRSGPSMALRSNGSADRQSRIGSAGSEHHPPRAPAIHGRAWRSDVEGAWTVSSAGSGVDGPEREVDRFVVDETGASPRATDVAATMAHTMTRAANNRPPARARAPCRVRFVVLIASPQSVQARLIES